MRQAVLIGTFIAASVLAVAIIAAVLLLEVVSRFVFSFI